jgi:hypothetical protein
VQDIASIVHATIVGAAMHAGKRKKNPLLLSLFRRRSTRAVGISTTRDSKFHDHPSSSTGRHSAGQPFA